MSTALHRLAKHARASGVADSGSRLSTDARYAAMLQAAQALVTREAGNYDVQTLSNLVWGLSAAGAGGAAAWGELYTAVALAAMPRLGEYNPQDLASTSWSFAKVRSSTEADIHRKLNFNMMSII